MYIHAHHDAQRAHLKQTRPERYKSYKVCKRL